MSNGRLIITTEKHYHAAANLAARQAKQQDKVVKKAVAAVEEGTLDMNDELAVRQFVENDLRKRGII